MAWKISFTSEAERCLQKIDRQAVRRILGFLNNRVANLDNPRAIGGALKGSTLGDFWKYRVGDYRIIADIRDKEIYICVLQIGHRREIYRPK